MKIKKLIVLIRSDCERFHSTLSKLPLKGAFRYLSILTRHEVLSLTLYRISHYLINKNYSLIANLLYRLNIFITGADIRPESVIGERCLIVHTSATVIYGIIGKNATIFAHVVILPSELSWDKAPVIGDSVTIGAAVTVVGDIQIADGVSISACSLIDENILQSHSVVKKLPGMKTIIMKKNNV